MWLNDKPLIVDNYADNYATKLLKFHLNFRWKTFFIDIHGASFKFSCEKHPGIMYSVFETVITSPVFKDFEEVKLGE